MKLLLENIVTRLTLNLTYLSWVGVLDSELLPPATPAPPFVGLKDGGLIATARPGRTDQEELRVIVVVYQAVLQDAPGASVLGEATLGNAGQGVLAIGEAIRALLTDELFANAFYYAHRERGEPSATMLDADGRMLQYQRHHYVYRRLQQ